MEYAIHFNESFYYFISVVDVYSFIWVVYRIDTMQFSYGALDENRNMPENEFTVE